MGLDFRMEVTALLVIGSIHWFGAGPIPPSRLRRDPALERQLGRPLEHLVRKGRHSDAILCPAALQEPEPHTAHVLMLADVEGEVC